MKWKISWTTRAIKDLQKLPVGIADRITEKMDWYAVQEDPLSFAKRLAPSAQATVRFRVGSYRVLCDVDHGIVRILIVVAVRDRKDAYQ